MTGKLWSSVIVGGATAVALGGIAVLGPLVVPSSGQVVTPAPIIVKYVVNGAAAGSGTAVSFHGMPYVSLAAVKKLTGASVKWDARTSTLSVGASRPVPPSSGTASYLEDLPGQPYYVSSNAICWQSSKDGVASGMHGFGTQGLGICRPVLPRSPTITGQHYAHALAVLVSANGSKAVQSSNAVTESYDLNGKYVGLKGAVGLADNPQPRPHGVDLIGDGKPLYSTELSPGSLSVSLAFGLLKCWERSRQGADAHRGQPQCQRAGLAERLPVRTGRRPRGQPGPHSVTTGELSPATVCHPPA